MAGEATCPSCGTRVRAGEPARAVRCPGCGKPVLADAPASHTLAQSRPGYGAAGVEHPYLAPPQAADEIGRLSKYRVLRKLGEGGFGAVFEAEDTVLGRRVALKVLLPHHATDRVAKARFLREAKTQALVEHDHVVHIYEVGEDRGVPFLAMQLLKGRNLADDLARTPRPAMSEVLRVAREMADGLAAAHDKGLIHRDVKPNNVWLEGDRRRVKILDFGLARPEEPDKSLGAGTVTREGGVIGTPLYMSPEQSLGDKVDRRTDLFSLGVVLYQMATGELPFQGTNQLAILMAVTTETPSAPMVRNPDCPRAFSDLVMRMLSKKAADRPASAREVCDQLQQVIDEAMRPAEPSGFRPALAEMASPAYAPANESIVVLTAVQRPAPAAPRPARQTPRPPAPPTPPERRPLPDRVTAGADRDTTRDDYWQPEQDLVALRRAKRVGGWLTVVAWLGLVGVGGMAAAVWFQHYRSWSNYEQYLADVAAAGLTGLPIYGAMLAGGASLTRGRRRRLGVAAAVLAVVPVVPLVVVEVMSRMSDLPLLLPAALLGPPVGVWALVELLSGDMAGAFRRRNVRLNPIARAGKKSPYRRSLWRD